MRVKRWVHTAALWLVLASGAGAQVAGPARDLTDPRTVLSEASSSAGPISLEDLFRTAQSDSAGWSADGRSVFYTSDRGGMLAVWRVVVDGSAPPKQIGPDDRKQAMIATTPDGRSILFQSDIGGRQINDIYALPVNGGAAVNLTQTPEVDETMAVPSPDGRFIAVARRAKADSSNNIAIIALRSGSVRKLTDEKTAGVQWWPVAVSRDGRRILANRFDWSQTLGEAWLIDVRTGAGRRLTPEGRYAEAGDIARDGRRVSVAVEDAKGIMQTGIVDLASGAIAFLPVSAWDMKPGLFSPDGRTMIAVRNVDGRDEVLLHDVAKGGSRALDLPPGTNARSYHRPFLPRFSPDGRKLLFPHSSGAEPLDYWVADLHTGQRRRLSDLGMAGGVPVVRTQLVRYRSRDGTVISAFLWMPYNLARDGRAPAVLRPHGGPTGQTTDTFDRMSAALASRGYVVLSPNFRGSTGYGRAFLDANQKDLGGGDLDDVAAGRRFLIETGFVDPRRVGIAGGSYGGYMTLMALAKTPELWAAGVDMFGIVNWRTMWEHGTLANRRYQQTLIGDPAVDGQAYDRASPLTYLANARAPLLVLHGENDPIVPAGEARQVTRLLKAKGGVVETHVYPEEGHGFARRDNQIDSIARTIAWFDTHMPPPRAADRSGR